MPVCNVNMSVGVMHDDPSINDRQRSIMVEWGNDVNTEMMM
jgi:hypothetical protein